MPGCPVMASHGPRNCILQENKAVVSSGIRDGLAKCLVGLFGNLTALGDCSFIGA